MERLWGLLEMRVAKARSPLRAREGTSGESSSQAFSSSPASDSSAARSDLGPAVRTLGAMGHRIKKNHLKMHDGI